jgi:hypothetical protein
LTPENLGYKGTSFDEEFDREFEGHKDKLRLSVSILNPGSTNIGSTVVKYNVRFPIFEFSSKKCSALWGSNIASEGRNARNWLYRNKINPFGID